MTTIVIILAVLLGLALIGCTVMIVVIVCQRIHASHLTQVIFIRTCNHREKSLFMIR